MQSESDTYDTSVSGVSFRQEVVARTDVGDLVQLVPEPLNRHDPHAIKVMGEAGQLGYIPKEQAAVLSRSLAAGAVVSYAAIVGKGKPDGSDSYGLTVRFTITWDGPNTDADGRVV